MPGAAEYQRNKTHCPQGHPYDELNTTLTKDGYRECRECHRISERRRAATDAGRKDAVKRMQRWRKAHPAEDKARHKARRKKAQEWIEIFKAAGCIRCGETHPGCLDFHHRDPGTKVFTIGKTTIRDKSKEQVAAEIEKCDVLCANCHRKLHWEERQLEGD